MGTVAKFGQVSGAGANGIRPIRRPPWGRMIAWPGTCGANAIRPYTDAKKRPGFYTKKTVWEPETWAVFACVSVWGDGLYPYGDQNHAWVGFP